MKADYASLSPREKAQADFRHGGGQHENPYPPGPEHDAYMMEMGRLWESDFKAEREQHNQEPSA